MKRYWGKNFRIVCILALAIIGIFVLTACGKKTTGDDVEGDSPPEETYTETELELGSGSEKGKLPIRVAEDYECVKTDTPIQDSGLVYTEAANDMLHVFIQQQPDEETCFYEYCTFDMLEGKWTEPEKCPWNDNLLKIADYAQAFHRDKDGNWYCMAKKK